MPSVSRINRFQKAVLWAFYDHDRHGRVRVSAAAELDVRWENTSKTMQGEDGSPMNVDAVVITDRVVTGEGIMWLGSLASVPSPVTNAMQVITCEEVPDMKGRVTQYSVLLKRYGDALPEVV